MITLYDILKTHSPYKPISIVGQVNKGTVNLTVFILISFTMFVLMSFCCTMNIPPVPRLVILNEVLKKLKLKQKQILRCPDSESWFGYDH